MELVFVVWHFLKIVVHHENLETRTSQGNQSLARRLRAYKCDFPWTRNRVDDHRGRLLVVQMQVLPADKAEAVVDTLALLWVAPTKYCMGSEPSPMRQTRLAFRPRSTFQASGEVSYRKELQHETCVCLQSLWCARS